MGQRKFALRGFGGPDTPLEIELTLIDDRTAEADVEELAALLSNKMPHYWSGKLITEMTKLHKESS